MRSKRAGATTRNPSLAYPSATEPTCGLTPKTSWTTTSPAAGSPSGRAIYALNSCPSAACKVTYSLISTPCCFQYPLHGCSGAGFQFGQALGKQRLQLDQRGREAFNAFLQLVGGHAVGGVHPVERRLVHDDLFDG